MKESLRVRKLGPLTDVIMDDIRPVMVLVGASGSGKSLLLKVLSMMRHVCKWQLIRRALKQSGVKKSSFRLRTDSYLQFADIQHLIESGTRIEYSLEYESFTLRVVMNAGKFTTELEESKTSFSIGPYMKIAFICDSRNMLALWARKGASIQSKVLDNFFGETYALWDESMVAKEAIMPSLDFIGSKLSIRGGKVGRRQLMVEDRNGHQTAFERSASGQKSSIPVALIVRYLMSEYDFKESMQRNFLKFYLDSLLDTVDRQAPLPNFPVPKMVAFTKVALSIHVEEPELSLDPITQLRFADDLMATLERGLKTKPQMDTSIFFTTHSPYWVTALNTIAQEGKNEYLTWNRLGGYLVTGSGRVESLRDEANQLLLTPNMDEATSSIDDRYNAALDRLTGEDK